VRNSLDLRERGEKRRKKGREGKRRSNKGKEIKKTENSPEVSYVYGLATAHLTDPHGSCDRI